MPRAASLTVYLFVPLLALSAAGCGGEPEAGSSSTRPIPELTEPAEEATAAATPPDAGGPSEAASSGVAGEPVATTADCEPTQPDMLGPYYVPDAPVRDAVDTGYVTSGRVLSADGCAPIPGARVEFWLADSQGVYDDAHRATVLAGEGGEYRFESNFPGLYEDRPPHVHIRVTAPGYGELVTQHYPRSGQTGANFDLVLTPA